MLGDNNCNQMCLNDPDCKNYSDICVDGCLYSEMHTGFCPMACMGSCFQNCSTNFCSPECLWYDIDNGNCKSSCTSNCSALCPTSRSSSESFIIGLAVGIPCGFLFLLTVFLASFSIHKNKNSKNKKNMKNGNYRNDLSCDYESACVLQPVPFNYHLHFKGDPICKIDNVDLKMADAIILLPHCSHIFHAKCINTFLNDKDKQKKCPNCTTSLEEYSIKL